MRVRLARSRHLPEVLAALLMLAAQCCMMAWAEEADDRLAVRTAYVNVRGGVFELNARASYPLNDDIRTALADGVTINIELQTQVHRRRRFWFDSTLVDVTLRRELSWHAVSERYILRETGSGEQQVYTTLDQALMAAGEVGKLARGSGAAAGSGQHLHHQRAGGNASRPDVRSTADADLLV